MHAQILDYCTTPSFLFVLPPFSCYSKGPQSLRPPQSLLPDPADVLTMAGDTQHTNFNTRTVALRTVCLVIDSLGAV